MNSGSNNRKQEPGRQGRLFRRPPSIVGGLIAAALVTLTLSASMVLGAQEQALVAYTDFTATATMPPPSATPSPVRPTSSPAPTVRPTLPAWVYPAAITLTPSSTPAPVTPTKTRAAKPTSSPTSPSSRALCRKPQGWVNYTIQQGDTLTKLAASYRTTVKRLKDVNCLVGDRIFAGTTLWVPFRLPPTATKRPTRTRTPTSAPTTATPDTATPTAPVTASATGTGTLEPPATETNTPGTSSPPTATDEPTDTPVPVTASDTPPPTNTPLPPTDTPVPVPPTDTPVPVPPTKVPPTNTPLPPTSTPTTETGTP
jgi:LysM repeat protein